MYVYVHKMEYGQGNYHVLYKICGSYMYTLYK